MLSDSKPCLIEFPKIGSSQLGYISVAENNNLPFEVKRIYWTYFTPESVERGGHSHYELRQILVAMAGRIIVHVESLDGTKEEFVLENPNVGLYMPVNIWHTMRYSHNAVQMCIASMVYEESDYIRDYQTFKSLK
ncbi:MAG: FdtA/QdtA family cupin domain-containing protein [Ferruginibacter sp.]